MAVQTIPPRIRWAVDLMDVQPADHVLEIGCGPGAGAELICAGWRPASCSRSTDPSRASTAPSALHRSTSRPAGSTVRQIDLATLRVPVKRLNKVFAFNVNLFWVRDVRRRGRAAPRAGRPRRRGLPFYEAARPELVPNIVKKASENLLRGGFRVCVVEQKAPPVVGIIAKR